MSVIFVIIIFTGPSLKFTFPFSLSSSYISTTRELEYKEQDHPRRMAVATTRTEEEVEEDAIGCIVVSRYNSTR